MTTYEAIIVALQSNLVMIGVLTLIIVIVRERKSNCPPLVQRLG